MRSTLLVLVAAFALLLTTSCTSLNWPSMGGSSKDPEAEAPSGASLPASQELDSYYYDFDDVRIYNELKLDAKESFVIETPGTKSGVLVFDGRVERLSLTDFFVNQMNRDGWRMRSAFKSPRTILIFEKPGKFGVINITDERFNTHVEIWVTSASGKASPRAMTAPPGAMPDHPEEIMEGEIITEEGLAQ